jgi:hypothetical protein
MQPPKFTKTTKEEEKRKRVVFGPSEDSTEGAPPKYCLVYIPSASKSQVPPPSPQWDHHPPQQQMCHIPKFSFRNVNHFSHKKLKISKKNSFILT